MCVTNLFATVEKRRPVDAIYTDLSNAFDSVDHDLLLKKLNDLVVGGSLLSWFDFFLKGKTQQVKIMNQLSSSFNVPSGIPQGGHLSPLIFLLFIKDVKNVFRSCKFSLFSDNPKIYW
jgi:hypothetical protein